jgi:hypothetical protein
LGRRLRDLLRLSDNDRHWLDIEHAWRVIGYDPQDNGEEWDTPPEQAGE